MLGAGVASIAGILAISCADASTDHWHDNILAADAFLMWFRWWPRSAGRHPGYRCALGGYCPAGSTPDVAQASVGLFTATFLRAGNLVFIAAMTFILPVLVPWLDKSNRDT